MIGFKDFEKPTKWLGLTTGTLAEAMRDANEWVASHAVIVLNIETIQTTKGLVGASTKEQGVRVFYILDEENRPRAG